MSLHRYATLTAAAGFLLLGAGSLVTSTDSGLAVPDWPLSYGMWFPPMIGGIAYEHGHRMIAGIVGIMVLVLALWLWRREPRQWVRRLGWSASGAVAVQALLGGMTVLLLLPAPVSIAHAALGQSVFCVLVCLALATSPGWSDPTSTPIVDAARPPVTVLTTTTAALVFIQLVLGAVIRHTGSSVRAHVWGAAAVAAMSLWCAVRAGRMGRRLPTLRGHAVRLVLLIGLQIAFGVSVFLHRGLLLVRTAHVLVGALILAQAVVLAWAARRDTIPTRRAVPRLCSGPRPERSRTGAAGRLGAYIELTKARLSGLVLMTTGVGFWMARPGKAEMQLLLPLCVGTALVVVGAHAINQWMERDVDARMHRTQHRPLPSGRLAPEAALRMGVWLSAIGLAVLAISVSSLSALLAAASWASYILIYTPLKRVTPLCTLAGAIPGALPPLIGWAGVRGTLDAPAWTLFAILFIWQLPHFLAIAVMYRDDYARAGLPLLPLVESDGVMTARQTALYGAALIPISLFPTVLGVSGPWYFAGAALLSVAFFAVALRAAWGRSPETARQLFLASVLYLPILLILLAADRARL